MATKKTTKKKATKKKAAPVVDDQTELEETVGESQHGLSEETCEALTEAGLGIPRAVYLMDAESAEEWAQACLDIVDQAAERTGVSE